MILLAYSSILIICGIIIACMKAYYDKKTEEKCRAFQTQANDQMETYRRSMQRPINITSSMHNESYVWKEGSNYVVKCAQCGYEQQMGEDARDIRKHLGYIGWIMYNRRPYCKYCKVNIFPERYGEKSDSNQQKESEQPTPTIPDETHVSDQSEKIIDEFK